MYVRCTDVDDLEARKKLWKSMLGQMNLLSAALKKTGQHVDSHIAQAARGVKTSAQSKKRKQEHIPVSSGTRSAKKAKKNRCLSCKKKLGLTGSSCLQLLALKCRLPSGLLRRYDRVKTNCLFRLIDTNS